jgi:hypothetical protein
LVLEERLLQSLLEPVIPAPFLMMILQVVGVTIGMANLEMELQLKETHLLKLQVLELEEQQLQSLLDTDTPALFLMMVL